MNVFYQLFKSHRQQFIQKSDCGQSEWSLASISWTCVSIRGFTDLKGCQESWWSWLSTQLDLESTKQHGTGKVCVGISWRGKLPHLWKGKTLIQSKQHLPKVSHIYRGSRKRLLLRVCPLLPCLWVHCLLLPLIITQLPQPSMWTKT